MKTYSRTLKYTGSILVLTSCFLSSNAAAALQNLKLEVVVDIMENLDSFDLVRCPGNEFKVGRSAGSGHIIITTNNKKDIITIPVKISASDCPDPSFNFNNGYFTLTALVASRDTLNATYHGSFIMNPVGGSLKLNSGAFSIAPGGTGIFAGASGSGHLQGGGQIVSLSPDITFKANLQGNGKISFPKSNFEEKYKIPPMPQ